jgi:hypothetical protein
LKKSDNAGNACMEKHSSLFLIEEYNGAIACTVKHSSLFREYFNKENNACHSLEGQNTLAYYMTKKKV